MRLRRLILASGVTVVTIQCITCIITYLFEWPLLVQSCTLFYYVSSIPLYINCYFYRWIESKLILHRLGRSFIFASYWSQHYTIYFTHASIDYINEEKQYWGQVENKQLDNFKHLDNQSRNTPAETGKDGRKHVAFVFIFQYLKQIGLSCSLI